MRASGGMWSSDQMPRSPGVMRPSGETAAASVKTRPAPPMARLPRWTSCQSSARPSVELYWHMGETAMRLGKVTLRWVSGEKRWVGRGDGFGHGGWMCGRGRLGAGLVLEDGFGGARGGDGVGVAVD